MRILMCEPRYFEVVYSINPWMKKGQEVDKMRAFVQWSQLKDTIERCGATVELIDQDVSSPDMVFTANAGFVFDHKVFLATFKHPQRQLEKKYFSQWFHAKGYMLHGNQDPVPFEGAGDLLSCGNKLFAASGFRTNPKVYNNISSLIPNYKVVKLTLVDPSFYHLDTCFCPLNDRQALVWPGAFSEESYKLLKQEIECLEVSQEDACKFSCNAVVINNHVILPEGCYGTDMMLHKLGFHVHSCDMSEFMKAGGAAKCLTLALPTTI